MTGPRLLDLFSCAGGAARGYQLAGFHVTGVDIAPQPRYRGEEWVWADALDVLADTRFLATFDAIHASPPCQAYSPLNAYNRKAYPDLVAPVRDRLVASGLPYVIENVPQAPLRDPMTLCGPMFGLAMYRHRDFESNVDMRRPGHPPHDQRCSRNGVVPTAERPYMSIHGGRHSRAWLLAAAEAMRVEWMVDGDTAGSIRRVCEAIPPAYTQHVGAGLMSRIEAHA